MSAAGTIGSAALAVKSFPAVKHEIGYYMAKYQCKTQSAIPTDEGATTATAKSAGGRLGNSATRQQNKAIDVYPSLAFNGTSATCTVTILGERTTDRISAVMELWQGNILIDDWSASASGILKIDETATVERNKTYKCKGS